MRINQIKQILEIEKSKSISQAARNLFISQPSLSMILNDMEDDLGIKIFTRTNKGIYPTLEGQQVLDTMKQIVMSMENLYNFKKNEAELTGDISLYVGPAYNFLIPEIIVRFKEVCPKANIH